MYSIQPYSYQQAKRIGVTIKPSSVHGKKIDVFKDDKKLASVGAIGYGDYPSFLKSKGKEYADERREAYKQRHQKDRTKKGTAGYYADKLLW